MRLAEKDLTTNAVLLDPGCMPTVKYLYIGSPDFDYIASYGHEIEEEFNCKMVPPIQVKNIKCVQDIQKLNLHLAHKNPKYIDRIGQNHL